MIERFFSVGSNIASIFFWSIWVSVFIFGIIWLLRLIKLLKKGIRTQGEIINIDVRKDSENSTTYIPIIKFYDQKGNAYEIKGDIVPYDTKIGQKADVYYFSGKPEKGKNNVHSLIFLAGFLIVMGSCAFILVIYEFFKMLNKI